MLICYTPLTGYLARGLAVREDLRQADAIVVLSGGVAPYGLVEGESLAREVRGVVLFAQGYAPYLVFSGGPAAGARPPDAEIMARLARKLGVPENRILTETRSADTADNARYTVALMQSRGWTRALLVTSNTHMKRALWFFRGQGIRAFPAPAPPWAPRASSAEGRLALFKALRHEYAALIAYRYLDAERARWLARLFRDII